MIRKEQNVRDNSEFLKVSEKIAGNDRTEVELVFVCVSGTYFSGKNAQVCYVPVAVWR